MSEAKPIANGSADDEQSLERLDFFESPAMIQFYAPIGPGDPPRFEYAEHRFLGDNLQLTMETGETILAANHLFTLANKAQLTYGEINALAGDFYGAQTPISDGESIDKQCATFHEAFWFLNENAERTFPELKVLKGLFKDEIDAFNKAVSEQQDPSVFYNKLKDINIQLEKATFGRPTNQPGYAGLSNVNWDHFGSLAHTAYAAGHKVALDEAAKPNGDLQVAYTLNAFADHFLEDSFSAGHVRTPRKQLHSSWNKAADLCAKFMHDEENAIGLSVTNKRRDKWTMYGDKKLKDGVDDQGAKICLDAVQASAKEVHQAWKDKNVPDRSQYAVWDIVPDLEQAQNGQKLVPLFKYDAGRDVVLRRSSVDNRKESQEYIDNYTYAGTLIEIEVSGLWKYPITLG